MSYILRPRRWLRKPPPNATAIDWNHPLTKGLAVAILFNENGGAPRDYVRMLRGSVATGTPLARNGGTKLFGDCWSWNGTAIPDSAFIGPITLIQRVNVLSTSTYRHFAGKHAGNGAASNPFDWRTNGFTQQSLVRANGSGGFGTLTGGTIDAGVEHTYAVSGNADNSNATFFTDRIIENVGGSTVGTIVGTNADLRIGQRADGGVGSDNIAQHFYGYSRTLGIDEVFALVEAPYQFLRPHMRRVYVGVAAGGTQSFSYTASGGITFAGAAGALRNRVLQAAGGLVFAGTSAMARVAARLASGGIVFGGAATVAFHSAVRTVQAAGGIVFGGNSVISYVGQVASEWILRVRRRGRR